MLQFIVVLITYLFAYAVVSQKCSKYIISKYNSELETKDKSRRKFKGSWWRFSVYLFLSIYGTFVLYNSPWFLHPYLYVKGIPRALVPRSIQLYYEIEFIHYFCGIMFLFIEPRMKDFSQMLLHHVVTLFLIAGSYQLNQYKFGVVVMFLHDISDPFLEFAKVCFYLEHQKMADIVFSLFAILFFFSRCILYPTVVVLPAILTATKKEKLCLINLIVFCLCVLFILNLIWLCFIIKMIFRFYKKGTVNDGDIRDAEIVNKKIK